MTRSSTSSSTWMLPLLLLLLFISFHQSSSQCLLSKEFSRDVEMLGEIVKNCSAENCSSVNITDTKCRCLNLTVSEGECAFPQYFLTGLDFLHPNITKKTEILHLKRWLHYIERMSSDCPIKKNFCTLPVKLEPIVSPKSFHETLKNLSQQYYANFKS